MGFKKVSYKELATMPGICRHGLEKAKERFGNRWPEEGVTVEDAIAVGVPLSDILYAMSYFQPRQVADFAIEVATYFCNMIGTRQELLQLLDDIKLGKDPMPALVKVNHKILLMEESQWKNPFVLAAYRVGRAAGRICLGVDIKANAYSLGFYVDEHYKNSMISEHLYRDVCECLIKWARKDDRWGEKDVYQG